MHCNIAESLASDGFDPQRPLPGIVIDYSADAIKNKSEIDWNMVFTRACEHFPPVRVEAMNKFTIAGSHLTMALRLFDARMTSSMSGRLFDAGGDTQLLQACQHGHKYVVLSGDIPAEDAVCMSNWRNADNNNSQVRHEMELIKAIARVCPSEERASKSCTITSIVTAVMANSPVKLNSAMVVGLVKFTADIGAAAYVDELAAFHSTMVNPNELSVSHTTFEECVRSIDKKYVLTRLALIKTACTVDKCVPKTRPTPDQANFVVKADFHALGSQVDKLDMLEREFQTLDRALCGSR